MLNTWTNEVYIKASNPDSVDLFGFSVALSDDGNTLAVGARREDGNGSSQSNNGSTDAGAVYIFVRDGGGTWTQQAYIKSSSVENNDQFGYSVALSADGNTLAAGAESDGNVDDTPANSGAVHVFIRCDDDWYAQDELRPGSLVKNDRFGTSVSISDDGDTVAAGANRADNFAGAVYVFDRDGNGGWSVQKRLTASNADQSGNGDLFGSSVHLSDDGNLLVVGAPEEDGDATGIDPTDQDNSPGGDGFDGGAAYVFERDGTDWMEKHYLKASNTDENDFFGTAVSVDGDGDVIAIGAGGEAGDGTGVNPGDNDNTTGNAGAVYAYE